MIIANSILNSYILLNDNLKYEIYEISQEVPFLSLLPYIEPIFQYILLTICFLSSYHSDQHAYFYLKTDGYSKLGKLIYTNLLYTFSHNLNYAH